jgi:multidrug efflux system outer membrane protein
MIMISRKTALILATGSMLAGCNLAPHYVRPALPVPPASPTGEAYGNGSGSAHEVTAETSWGAFFTDPRLREVIRTTLENNRNLRVAVANVEQARALYRVQRADLFPTVGAAASATYQRSPLGAAPNAAGAGPGAGNGPGNGTGSGPVGSGISPRSDIYSVSTGISAWEIDLFGRVRNLNTAAQERYLAAAENRDAAQVALIAETAAAWLTMAADQDRLRIARDTAGAFGETLRLTEARFRLGVSSELDVRQARTSFDQARADIANATTLAAQDRNALNLLAGTTLPETLLPLQLGPDPATLTALPAGLSSDLLLRRPDIASAEHQLLAANANIGAARAAFFPNISLTAAFGTLSLGLSNLFGNGSDFWSVAPSVTVPIFDAGRNKGNLRYARATYDAMLSSYEATVQSAFRETADALARRGTIGSQLEAQISLRDNAQGAYALAELRFKAGIDPFLNTLDAQRTLYGAQQGVVATRLVRETNAVELYRTLGGGLR